VQETLDADAVVDDANVARRHLLGRLPEIVRVGPGIKISDVVESGKWLLVLPILQLSPSYFCFNLLEVGL
jgi:hypothetical protein